MDVLIRSVVPIIVALAFVAILAAVVRLLKVGNAVNKSLPYQKRESLMTPAELLFFRELEKAVGGQFRIFAKVRLWDVIDMERGLDQKARGSAKGKIQSKHVDFVACDPRDMTIKFVVELDDSSHKRTDRQSRDIFMDRALAAAGVPIIRFPAQRAYDVGEIRDKIPA